MDLGAGRLRTFLRVNLPLSLPGINSGCLLVFILTVGSFVTPELLGGPKEIMIANIIPAGILRIVQLALWFRSGGAVAAGRPDPGRFLQPAVQAGTDRGLGMGLRWLVLRLWTAAVYLFLFLPIATVIFMSFNASKYSIFPPPGLTARWYLDAAQDPNIWMSIRNSLLISVLRLPGGHRHRDLGRHGPGPQQIPFPQSAQRALPLSHDHPRDHHRHRPALAGHTTQHPGRLHFDNHRPHSGGAAFCPDRGFGQAPRLRFLPGGSGHGSGGRRGDHLPPGDHAPDHARHHQRGAALLHHLPSTTS